MDLERLDALSSMRGRKRNDCYPLKRKVGRKGCGLEIDGLRQTEQKEGAAPIFCFCNEYKVDQSAFESKFIYK